MKNKQKLNKYEVVIKFKRLSWWYKTQVIKAKSEKKACDIVRRMYKDDVLSLEVLINND